MLITIALRSCILNIIHMKISDIVSDFRIFVSMKSGESIDAKFDRLFDRIDKLEEEVSDLRSENSDLRTENSNLKDRLAHYETPKNSGNSHKPPSSDISKPKRTNSLRTKSGKKPGGQSGHKGTTLKMQTPDVIEEIHPSQCERCGRSLSGVPSQYVGSRQIIDLPEIKTICREYQVYETRCTCGCCSKGQYPDNVKSAVSYGPNVQSLVTYLSSRQYIPFNRLHELMSEIMGTPISTGGINYIMEKFAKKSFPRYEQIRQNVLNSPVIGGDETGANVNGSNHWFWTFQNHMNTFIAIHKSRGTKAINELAPEGFLNNILVTDCWLSYFKGKVKGHQLCTAHLLRELEWLGQRFKFQTWSFRMSYLLIEAIKLWNDGLENAHDKIRLLKDKLWDLLIDRPKPQYKELYSFYKRMIKHQKWTHFGKQYNGRFEQNLSAWSRGLSIVGWSLNSVAACPRPTKKSARRHDRAPE